MKITPYSNLNAASVNKVPKVAPPHTVAGTEGNKPAVTSKDTPDVSPEARMLARNRSALAEMLQPREEVLRKFADTIDEPIELHDRNIDRLLQNLQNA